MSTAGIDVCDLFDPGLLAQSALSGEEIDALNAFCRQLDQGMSDEFLTIAQDIARTRDELRHFSPGETAGNVPGLDAELDAITRDTESATNTILTAAEALIALDARDPAIKARADALVVSIFEACSFQDLVGQRVSKVVRVLEGIEARISRLGAITQDNDGEGAVDQAEQRRRDLILNGPAVGGPETSQSEVDAFFN